jgi:hypothetical protein
MAQNWLMQYPERWRLRIEPDGDGWKFWREEPVLVTKDGRELWLRSHEGTALTENGARQVVETEARNNQGGLHPVNQPYWEPVGLPVLYFELPSTGNDKDCG